MGAATWPMPAGTPRTTCRTAMREQPGIGLGGRGVRVVLALVTSKVALARRCAPVRAACRSRPSGGNSWGSPRLPGRCRPIEKCWLDNNPFTLSCACTAARKLAATSPSSVWLSGREEDSARRGVGIAAPAHPFASARSLLVVPPGANPICRSQCSFHAEIAGRPVPASG